MEKPFSKHDLIESVAEKSDLSKVKSSEVVEVVLSSIEGALRKGREVRFVGFGSFVITERKATKGRNPRTKEEIDIPASTSVRFKPGKALKDALNVHDKNSHAKSKKTK